MTYYIIATIIQAILFLFVMAFCRAARDGDMVQAILAAFATGATEPPQGATKQ